MSRVSGIVRVPSDLELPEEILSVIPTDPYEQLDLAKKITSMAIISKVSNLEAEVVELSQKLQEMELTSQELETKASRSEDKFREVDSRLIILIHDNVNLTKERDSLATTVTNLNHEIAKFEAFKRKLIQSISNENAPQTESGNIRTYDQSVPKSYPDKASKHTDPRFSVSHSITPTRTFHSRSKSTAGSLQSTSGAVSPTNTTLSYPSSHQSSATNSPPRPARTRTPRIDVKELFRQTRSRLTYEQFRAFLANVKEMNAPKQTLEETLSRANEIFGSENKDLLPVFPETYYQEQELN